MTLTFGNGHQVLCCIVVFRNGHQVPEENVPGLCCLLSVFLNVAYVGSHLDTCALLAHSGHLPCLGVLEKADLRNLFPTTANVRIFCQGHCGAVVAVKLSTIASVDKEAGAGARGVVVGTSQPVPLLLHGNIVVFIGLVHRHFASPHGGDEAFRLPGVIAEVVLAVHEEENLWLPDTAISGGGQVSVRGDEGLRPVRTRGRRETWGGRQEDGTGSLYIKHCEITKRCNEYI